MEIGIVRPVLIEEEMKGAYLDYAMSVITARALPDVRDGLKPVQRRILYAMDELALRHTTAYKKSARIVGEVMGKYHPHGDAPVYESMVRLAQDFSMRYQLVDGQGNFGSVDGDPAAAMRYTEARLASLAEQMLADIDKNTVDFASNFDDTLKEPRVLPGKLPNLLVNGSAGIAVGMATNIPPHNLGEVVDALTHIIGRFGEALGGGVPFPIVWARAFGGPVDLSLAAQALPKLSASLRARVEAGAAKLARQPGGEHKVQALLDVLDDLSDVPPDTLMAFVKGPDFPTAGIILGSEGIKNAYATGHGRVTIRARAHTEDMRGGRTQIVVTELPFQVNKATLLEKIAELVRERRVEGISELRDESDRQGMRVVIELRREAQPRQILNQLYKYTAMQTTFSANLLALVDGQPRVLTLKMMLLHYLDHRREVITRRTEFDLQKARHRAHILEGLKIALDHLDEVIATIRRSKDADTARGALIKNFKLSELQAQAVLDMQLRRLAALERQKMLDEYKETLKLIAHFEDLLAHPAKILYLIRDELLELKQKYGDARRTQIRAEEAVDFTEEDLVPDQEVVVSLSAKGYVRRLLADSFRVQRRGTKGITGSVSKEDDPPLQLVVASTRDILLLFSSRGRAYQVKVNDLPDSARQARGLPIGNFASLEEPERIVALLPLSKLEGRSIVLATRRGEVKRVAASEYASARGGGVIGIALPDGDELVGAVATSGRQEVMLVSAAGQAIRFAEQELRLSGRNSGGVRGMRLGDDDPLIALAVARANAQLAVVTRRGFGKRTSLAEFNTQGRGGGGIRAATVSVKNGELVAAHVGGEADELLVATSGGTVLRTPLGTLPEMGRVAQGQPVISLGRDEKVLAAAVVPGREKSPGETKLVDGKGEAQGAADGVPLRAVPGKAEGTKASEATPAKAKARATERQGSATPNRDVEEGDAAVAGGEIIKSVLRRVSGSPEPAKGKAGPNKAGAAKGKTGANKAVAKPSVKAAKGDKQASAAAAKPATKARKVPATGVLKGKAAATVPAKAQPPQSPAAPGPAAKNPEEGKRAQPAAAQKEAKAATEARWRPIEKPATGSETLPVAMKGPAAAAPPGAGRAKSRPANKVGKSTTLLGSIASVIGDGVRAADGAKKAKGKPAAGSDDKGAPKKGKLPPRSTQQGLPL